MLHRKYLLILFSIIKTIWVSIPVHLHEAIALIEKLGRPLTEKERERHQKIIAEKNSAIAEKDCEIAELKARLAALSGGTQHS